MRLEGQGARLADWTWTLREPEVMRGRPPAEPPKGPGRDRGSPGPALKVFPPGPRPEERREPCLPGLGGGSFPGRRRDCFPLPPPTTPAPHTPPRPAPAVSQPRPLGKDPFRPERSCPRGPRNRQAGRRRERSRATPLIPGAAPAHLCTWRGAAHPGTSAAADIALRSAFLLAVTGCILCFGGLTSVGAIQVTAISPVRAGSPGLLASVPKINTACRSGWFSAQFLQPSSFRA